MLANNNSEIRICALNLLRTIRGEVPMARTKGLAREHIDAPVSTQASEMRADIAWVLETYEPRLSSKDADVIANNAVEGNYDLLATVK